MIDDLGVGHGEGLRFLYPQLLKVIFSTFIKEAILSPLFDYNLQSILLKSISVYTCMWDFCQSFWEYYNFTSLLQVLFPKVRHALLQFMSRK